MLFAIGEGIVTLCGADPGDFIGHNTHPNAGTADQDPTLVFALFNRHRHRMGNIRINGTPLARARKSNNAQIITLGARVIGAELGKKIIQAWLESEYEGGGSAPKVERIDYYEHQHARD